MTDEEQAETERAAHLPYFVELYQNGCLKCGEGRLWDIVGPDGSVVLGQPFGDEEEADNICEALNEAYEVGKRIGAMAKPVTE